MSLPGASGNFTSGPYRAGTLVYTRAGLFLLFAWLLWGDFCYSLMETVWPAVLPLKLKAEGAPNTAISLAMTTVPSAMNFVLNPIISTSSDRFRSRWGRRIPFLLFATPFIALTLVLTGFSRPIAAWLHSHAGGLLPGLSQSTLTLGLILILVVAFRFFELFVGTVYYYLFNDVVPLEVMGRFLGFFRVVGALAGALFNFFIFRYAESHAGWIFIGAGIFYGVAFTLMCLNVREGEYPPPPPLGEGTGLTARVRGFVTECLSQRIYRLTFLMSGLWAFAVSINSFNIFLWRSLGISLDQIGKVTGFAGFLSVVLMYPMGMLVDRFHPIRVYLFAQAALCCVVPVNLVYLFLDVPDGTAFWLYAGFTFVATPLAVAYSAAGFPLLMRLLPKESFGQFSAANAMAVSTAIVAGGLLSGIFLDLMKSAHGAGEGYYRFVPVWTLCFQVVAVFATLAVFREWKRLGGDTSYEPPPHPSRD